MYSKQEVIAGIKALRANGTLSEHEVLAALSGGEKKASRMAEILYYIGGAIVCIGVAVLVSQQWENLPTLARIVSTLGVGLAAYVTATLLMSRAQTAKVSLGFWLIAGAVLPIGLFVTFYEGGYAVASAGVSSLIFALLFITYLLSHLIHRKVILLLFTTIYGVALFFVFTSFQVAGNPIFVEPEFSEYRFLLTGISLFLLGYFVRTKPEQALTGTLYAAGSLAFLGSALALGGFKPEQHVFWELVFPLLAFAAILGSVQLRSKSLLTIGSLSLMAYIIKITMEYFSESLGWPLALVIAGLLIIGVGYGSLRVSKQLNKKM